MGEKIYEKFLEMEKNIFLFFPKNIFSENQKMKNKKKVSKPKKYF